MKAPQMLICKHFVADFDLDTIIRSHRRPYSVGPSAGPSMTPPGGSSDDSDMEVGQAAHAEFLYVT